MWNSSPEVEPTDFERLMKIVSEAVPPYCRSDSGDDGLSRYGRDMDDALHSLKVMDPSKHIKLAMVALDGIAHTEVEKWLGEWKDSHAANWIGWDELKQFLDRIFATEISKDTVLEQHSFRQNGRSIYYHVNDWMAAWLKQEPELRRLDSAIRDFFIASLADKINDPLSKSKPATYLEANKTALYLGRSLPTAQVNGAPQAKKTPQENGAPFGAEGKRNSSKPKPK